jgi:hypothetical protein
MKKIASALLLGVILAGQANAATAFLVRQYIGKSVTGIGVLVCVYKYGSQQFEKAYPMGSVCAPSVEIQ